MRLFFPKKYHIAKKTDFDQIHQHGQKFVSRYHIVFYKENGLDHVRLGVSVRRAFGTAVERNRFRRVVKETVRVRQHDLAGLDLHIVARISKKTVKKQTVEAKIRADLITFAEKQRALSS